MDIQALVKTKLKMIGYEIKEEDQESIDYAIGQAEMYLKIQTNQCEVPSPLYYVWSDYAAGVFLRDKNMTGGLTESDTESIIQSIKEGDINVSFSNDADNSPSVKLRALIDKLMTPDFSLIAAFRRLVW